MKKTLSAVIACLLLLASVLALVSCDSPEDGLYVSSSGISFEICGEHFVFEDDQIIGYAKYEIDDTTLRLSFDRVEFVGSEANRAEFEENRELIETRFKNEVCRTFEYEKTDGAIVLDGLTFTKQ